MRCPVWRRAVSWVSLATMASTLLTAQQDVVPRHGDRHHGNVWHFGQCGWLAIDPKRLIGERTFRLSQHLLHDEMATAPGGLTRQLHVPAKVAQREPRRLPA
jgi:streptomycin 6-kinase